MRRVLLRTSVALISALLIGFTADYGFLRFRISTKQGAFGTVEVQRYYTVPRKDGKMELFFDQPETDTCVHSVFPHLGDSPCWYLSRHKDKRVNM